MLSLISTILHVLLSGLQSRSQLLLENMALRHQLTVLRRSVPKPRLHGSDRLLWTLLERCWSDWRRALLIVQPRTDIGWHRLGFRLFWRWKSRVRGGRPSLDRELITLIRRECLDYMMVLNAQHLRRGLTQYFDYYRRHRPRRSLAQDCPEPRAVEPPDQGKIVELPLVSGLHHRYARQVAA
jgi:hypothetical protein